MAGGACGLAQGLAELGCAGAQLRRGRGPLRPHPHRCLVAGQRHQRMNGTRGLDIERETRPPYPLGGFGLDTAAVAGNLEMGLCLYLRTTAWYFIITTPL